MTFDRNQHEWTVITTDRFASKYLMILNQDILFYEAFSTPGFLESYQYKIEEVLKPISTSLENKFKRDLLYVSTDITMLNKINEYIPEIPNKKTIQIMKEDFDEWRSPLREYLESLCESRNQQIREFEKFRGFDN